MILNENEGEIMNATVSEYHELIDHLMTVAEALGSSGDNESKKIVVGIVEKKYLAQMAEVDKAKALVSNPETIEKYIVPGYAYIKEWLDAQS